MYKEKFGGMLALFLTIKRYGFFFLGYFESKSLLYILDMFINEIKNSL